MNFYDDFKDFMHEFYGYGNFEAPYWFVGMEEAGEDTHSYIRVRVDRWANQRGALVDLKEFNNIEWFEYFENNHPIFQSTWRPLLLLLFNLKGHKTYLKKSRNLSDMRIYQATQWGQKSGETCLAELFPLPCSSNRNAPWIYEKYKNRFPFLKTKTSYEKHLSNLRVFTLNSKITKYEPRFVIFNGLRYMQEWTHISGATLQKKIVEGKNFYIAKPGNTTFVAIEHSSNRVPNKYFEKIGSYLRTYY